MIETRTAGRLLTFATAAGFAYQVADAVSSDSHVQEAQVEAALTVRNASGGIVEEFGTAGSWRLRLGFQSPAATT